MKKIIFIIFVIALIAFTGGFVFYKTIEINANRHVLANLKEAKRVYDAIPIWHKKIHTQQDLKIGIITDTHVRSNRVNRSNDDKNAPRSFKEKYTRPLRDFVAQMKKFQPEYIIHGGDIIEGTDDPDWLGITDIKMVREELEKINVPIYWVLGNHDLRSLTKQQFKQTIGIDEVHQVVDTGDYRFIIIDGNFNPKNDLEPSPNGNKYIPGFVSEKEVNWLKEQLSTDKRTFVFLHQSVFPHELKGDKNNPKDTIYNTKELMNIFKEYRVDGFFNGHIESLGYDDFNGTEYFSLTGTKRSQMYPESYYELTIINGDPSVMIFYKPTSSSKIKNFILEEKCDNLVRCGDPINALNSDEQ